jgi:cyclic pyranopterin phosphate synthase
MSAKLSHTSSSGRAVMVDVGDKTESKRIATASGFITLQPSTVKLIRENLMKKGDVLGICETAGVMAAKKTAELIPLCHNLFLENIQVKASLRRNGVEVQATSRCSGKTGVEMEALTAVSVALLTVYDMCKAVDKKMMIGEITLVSKTKEAL